MSGLIPQHFINDLLGRVDILDVVQSRLTLKKSGANRYLGLCPFHDEKSPSFNVNTDRQFYYCFGCRATGSALKFLMQFDRLDFVPAVEVLAAIAGVEVPREKTARAQSEATEHIYKALEAADQYYRAMLRQHADAPRAVAYLKGRGLQGITAKDFGIGFAPPGWDNLVSALATTKAADLMAAGLVSERESSGGHYDRFRDRIMFPIRDLRGRVIAFGGRVLGDEKPKYLNSPETAVFHKGRELYGLYEARRVSPRLDTVLLVEGYMDVVALAQAGISNVVATLGTATGMAHFEKLFRYTPSVVCCFDGDTAGREAAWKALAVALPALSAGHQLSFVFLPDGEDPDTLVRKEGRTAFDARVKSAVTAAEYLFSRLSQGIDRVSLDGRARLADLALPYIRKVPDGVLKEMMLRRLAELTELAPEALKRTVDGGGTSPATPRAANRRVAMGADTSRISEYLLSVLVQHPQLLSDLDPARRTELLALEDSVIGRVARYLAENPQDDTAALLGYWMGEPEHEQLLTCAQRALMMAPQALRREFEDAVDQCLAARSKANRSLLLEDLRADGSVEKLAAYWQLKQQGD